MSAGLLQSAKNFLAGLLELGRTRFELFGTELREELAALATTLLGGLAALVLAAFGLGFAALALIVALGPEHRLLATGAVAGFFLLAAGLLAWRLYRLAAVKPRAFEATLSELQRDLDSIRS